MTAQPGRCSVAGCGRPVAYRGWCGAHYHRWQRHGDVLAHIPLRVVPSPEERLWARVDRTGGPEACWRWLGPVMPNGYGRIQVGGKDVYVHRFAYETVVGRIPDGLVIDHLCRNKRCVNPAHLEPVTTRTNVLRGVGFVAVNALKTHCPKGHEYTEANTRRKPNGWRDCKECAYAYVRRWKARRRAERAAA
jgi:hypothetical protein